MSDGRRRGSGDGQMAYNFATSVSVVGTAVDSSTRACGSDKHACETPSGPTAPRSAGKGADMRKELSRGLSPRNFLRFVVPPAPVGRGGAPCQSRGPVALAVQNKDTRGHLMSVRGRAIVDDDDDEPVGAAAGAREPIESILDGVALLAHLPVVGPFGAEYARSLLVPLVGSSARFSAPARPGVLPLRAAALDMLSGKFGAQVESVFRSHAASGDRPLHGCAFRSILVFARYGLGV
jgi:hypothetical protein